MKVSRTTSNLAWERLEPHIAQPMRNNSRWFKWSKDTRLSPNSKPESTRTSKVSERREFPSLPNPTIEDSGKPGPLSKEMVWSTSASQETGQESCIQSCQHSSSSTSVNQLCTVLFTFSSITTTSGTPSTSSSPWTEYCSQIKQLPDSPEENI